MPLHSGATRGGNEIPCQFGMRHKLSLLSGRVVRLTAKGFCSQPGRAGAELGLSERSVEEGRPPIHLYLIFEKSSWKNQVRQTGFLVYSQIILRSNVLRHHLHTIFLQ